MILAVPRGLPNSGSVRGRQRGSSLLAVLCPAADPLGDCWNLGSATSSENLETLVMNADDVRMGGARTSPKTTSRSRRSSPPLTAV